MVACCMEVNGNSSDSTENKTETTVVQFFFCKSPDSTFRGNIDKYRGESVLVVSGYNSRTVLGNVLCADYSRAEQNAENRRKNRSHDPVKYVFQADPLRNHYNTIQLICQ